ncbi:hypothetical protein C9933_00295 [Methylophaga nitratireducenticrescens]|nr:hypothetical protein C9933_00295 [Methylophaga nitratireducenticrescens]
MNMTMTNNEIISKKMNDVIHCLAELARRGCTITTVEIKDGKPRITIASFHKTPGGLRGGTLTRIKQGDRRLETYATELNGCQVMWKIPA